MKKNLTLGISFGYNASACIMDEQNNVLYAASEERFTNVKNCKFFPTLAINNGIEFLGLDPKDITACYYSHYQEADIYDMYRHSYGIDNKIPYRLYSDRRNYELEKNFIDQHLYMLGIDVNLNIWRINHHVAHAYSAKALTPFTTGTNLYVVMDGFGDGYSARLCICDDKKTEIKAELPLIKSPAIFKCSSSNAKNSSQINFSCSFFSSL